MRINSVSNVTFGAQTKKGNDYKKTHVGFAYGIIASSLTGASQIIAEVYKGNLAGKAVKKPVSIAAAAVAASGLIGAGIDWIINIRIAKKADENPMTLNQKFVRDFNSSKFGIYYDTYADEVVVENKKESDRYKYVRTDRSKKDNKYSLKEDGSVRITAGRDCCSKKPFIENSEKIKDIVNRVKISKFESAAQNRNYIYRYDSENDMVTLSRPPENTPFGPYFYDSFKIKSDGSILIVTGDGHIKRPINGIDALALYEEYSERN